MKIDPQLLALFAVAMIVVEMAVQLIKAGVDDALTGSRYHDLALQTASVLCGAAVFTGFELVYGSTISAPALLTAAVFGMGAGFAACGHYDYLTSIQTALTLIPGQTADPGPPVQERTAP